MSTPLVQARPYLSLSLRFAGEDDVLVRQPDVMFHRFEFKAMANGGYIVYCRLFDAEFGMLHQLVENGYLDNARAIPVEIRFQMSWGPNSVYPTGATREQLAYLTGLRILGNRADIGYLEFVAIDPPSWFLNTGDAAGKVYKGRVSDAIRQVVNHYAPKINLELGRTVDSDSGRWYMMRQDPKTFINSLLDWSSSVTQQQTHWLVLADNLNLTIKEQGEFSSQQRAYYRYHVGRTHNTVTEPSVLADNALSLSTTKLVTQGMSAISGQFLDRITDRGQQQVFAKDTTTPNKLVAKTTNKQSFIGPDDGQPPEDNSTCGWTGVSSIPEFSAGDLGKQYSNYIDGRARGLYLNLMNLLLRAKFRVLGHGEWDSCTGLGVDTIFVRWVGGDGHNYMMSGNWIAYGFHHIASRQFWHTDVYAARYDSDSAARRVGA